MIASDPPQVVHLITRAQGGLHDYQAFLHEAGHALHYAGCDPALPYTFRKLSRDHALTEIYSYILEAITREPAGTPSTSVSPTSRRAENAEATAFLEALLFRRYTAKLQFELDFWAPLRRRRRHRRRLRTSGSPAATGVRYRRDAYLSDMDAGFYSADYLRAWIRSAQLRAYLVARGRRGLVARAGDGRAAARAVPARARARRARRSPRGSASSRSTPGRCSPS